ncbi:hypothetical protein GGI23_007904 [Coemansia sp. RSA 2559]|nr:hypothetical protein GGI23_007904 [Coemansia sp. RSA 2559]
MSVVTLFVESQNSSSERRFLKSITIDDLKTRLEPVVGIPASDQQISILQGTTHVRDIPRDAGDKMLGYFSVEDYMALRVTNANPSSAAAINFNDDSQVEKYMMDDDEYDKRTDTVRAFKRRHNMGRFADGKSAMSIDEEDEFKELAAAISVGSRCEVATVPGVVDYARRGTVRFVGKTSFRPGYWVGIEYDEPVGKNDGSVEGVQYFKCPSDHGSFVRPDKVTVGDFPEEDLFGSDLEEM